MSRDSCTRLIPWRRGLIAKSWTFALVLLSMPGRRAPVLGTRSEVSCGFRETYDQPMDLMQTIPNAMSKIVGGIDSLPAEWPWMVSLQLNKGHFCGGSIISHWWILTAAHCIMDVPVKNLRVLVGHTQLEYGTQLVKKIIKHPKYSKISGDNDIALLLLASSLYFNKETVPICLPPRTEIQPVDWKTCYVTGWGTTVFDQAYYPTVLMKVKILLYSLHQCLEWLHSLTKNMLCAGFSRGGKDACQGDSGGPLVCRSFTSKTWYQIGIVSWGRGCGEPNKPGVYVVVSNYIKWIEKVTSSQGKPLEMISSANRQKVITDDSYDFGNVTSSTDQRQNLVFRTCYLLGLAFIII